MKLSSMIAAVVLAGTAATAQAGILNFYTNLAPDTGGTGSGSALVSFNDVTNVLSFTANFSGLSGLTTAAHFHCCTASPRTGTAGIAVDSPSLPIPTGVSSGSFGASLDLDESANFNDDFLLASGGSTDVAIARLISAFYAGTAYLNIHTGGTFSAGEIRGFLQVPEPSSALLAGLSLAALGFTLRKRSA